MNSNNISIKVLTKSNFSKNYDMGQIPAGYFAMSGIRGHVFNEETAKEGLKSTLITFVVVLLRQTLAGDEIDPYLYDRDAGQGKFAKIVDDMRNEEQK